MRPSWAVGMLVMFGVYKGKECGMGSEMEMEMEMGEGEREEGWGWWKKWRSEKRKGGVHE